LYQITLMRRAILDQLTAWKTSRRRKPLLLQGARQVGKTYAVKAFAEQSYTHFVSINFELQTNLYQIFERTLEPKEILEDIAAVTNQKISSKDTLIFFDEIQACPRAITALKYFQEKAPEYNIIAAGSLLGVDVRNNHSFPVGKVNFMTMYPMSFYEFLLALNQDALAEKIKQFPYRIEEPMHSKLMELISKFIFIGGMPEVVASYINTKDYNEVRTIQNEILSAYERDFSKYTAASQAIKLKELWASIPYQLSKENKKFKYSDIKARSRAVQYDATITWLSSAGLIHCVNQIRTIKLPLKSYADHTKFKIYLLDTGLLGAMNQTPHGILFKDNALFSEYNGALLENYVCTELVKATNTIPHYWVSNSEAEVDFVVDKVGEVIPIEVKAGLDRTTKSIRSYQSINKADKVYRASPRLYSESDDGFINIAHYQINGLMI
jgi:uncharacterized protein